MGYQTPSNTTESDMPRLTKDFTLQRGMCEERARKLSANVLYYCVDKRLTPVTPQAPMSGESGSTQFDPVWGEATATDSYGNWIQAHRDPTVSAATVTKFLEAQSIPAQFRKEASDDELKRWGFDRIKDGVFVLTAYALDQRDIACQPGDVIEYGTLRYKVMQWVVDGLWHQTNIPMYVVLNCETERKGS